MKKLWVVLAVVLVLTLVFSIVGVAKQEKPDVLCKATGGVQLYYPEYEWADKVNFTFNVHALGGYQGKGEASWVKHNPMYVDAPVQIHRVEVTYAECLGDGQMVFGGNVETTPGPPPSPTLYFYVIDGGTPGGAGDEVNTSWGSPANWDYGGVPLSVEGGNLVVRD